MRENTKNNDTRCVVLTPQDGVEAACHIIKRLDIQADIEHCPLLAMAELGLLLGMIRGNSTGSEMAYLLQPKKVTCGNF